MEELDLGIPPFMIHRNFLVVLWRRPMFVDVAKT